MSLFYIWTIGCQMNKTESNRLSTLFAFQGYTPTEDAGAADFIILNTCVVRGTAESKVTNKLAVLRALKKKRPDLKLAVTGCFVDSDATSLAKKYPFVDHFFKAGELPGFLGEIPQNLFPDKPSVCQYVPIIQGCNNFCTYCIVPYRRGREKSRRPQDIICEVRALVGRGVKEVTLLGQNVDSYGHDLPGAPDLADLLTSLNDIEGLYRIRFLTNHPKDMGNKLITVIAKLDKICEAINLPVQAGDDEILAKMNRGYTAADYVKLLAELRFSVPGIAVTTDIITGFPGETEAQFEKTRRLLQELRFDAAHLAAYSPRAGTIAESRYADDVPPDTKKKRLGILEELQADIAGAVNAQLLDIKVEVLVEDQDRGKWRGRSRSDKLIFFKDPRPLAGQLVTVHIEKTSPWSLQGRAIN